MKKCNFVKSFTTILLLGGGLFALTCLSSCENFLTGDEAKDDISKSIEYANASSYKIFVVADNEEGQVKKPITGEVTKKVTDTFEIKFEPAKDHTFVRWEASSEDLSESDSINNYIEFEDPTNPDTFVTFKKALENIVIKAFCPSRPYTSIKIDGSNGKFSPSKATYDCIESYDYPLNFEPDSDYEFLRWEFFNVKTGAIINNGTYIEIKDIYESNTTYKLVEVPADAEIKLGVRPLIAERPQVISTSPDSFGVCKDSTIQVLFDRNMDSDSIYFSDDEKKALFEEGVTVFNTNADGKIYSYIKDGETFFKNIMIRNKSSQKNINNCFQPPRFENPSTLIIAANKTTPILDNYTQVLVTIDKGFYYRVNYADGKHVDVSMPGSRKWMYQVNSKTDTTKMSVTENGQMAFKLKKKITGDELEKDSTYTLGNGTGEHAFSTLKYVNGNSLDLTVEVNDLDDGSGPADFFYANVRRIYDGSYNSVNEAEQSFQVNYHSRTLTQGSFQGEVDMSSWNLDNGIYSIYFTFSDKSNNSNTYPVQTQSGGNKYYFGIDKTDPDMGVPRITTAEDGAGNFTLDWSSNSVTDLKKTTIRYKKKNDTEWSSPITVDAPTKDKSISGLAGNTNYDIEVVYEDYNSNKTKVYPSVLTRPLLSALRKTSYTPTTVSFEWDAPEGGCEQYFLNLVYETFDKGKKFLSWTGYTTDTSFTVPQVYPYGNVQFQVIPINSTGNGLCATILTHSGPEPRQISEILPSRNSEIDIISECISSEYKELQIFVAESEEVLRNATTPLLTVTYEDTMERRALPINCKKQGQTLIEGKFYYVKLRTVMWSYTAPEHLYTDSNVKGFLYPIFVSP